MIELAKAMKSCGVIEHASGPEKQPPLRLDVGDTKRIRAALWPILVLVDVCERVAEHAEGMNWASVSRPLREALKAVRVENENG